MTLCKIFFAELFANFYTHDPLHFDFTIIESKLSTTLLQIRYSCTLNCLMYTFEQTFNWYKYDAFNRIFLPNFAHICPSTCFDFNSFYITWQCARTSALQVTAKIVLQTPGSNMPAVCSQLLMHKKFVYYFVQLLTTIARWHTGGMCELSLTLQ